MLKEINKSVIALIDDATDVNCLEFLKCLREEEVSILLISVWGRKTLIITQKRFYVDAMTDG